MTRQELVLELAQRISRISCAHSVRVAIDGVDAAGKTTLADELVAPLERLGRPVIRASPSMTSPTKRRPMRCPIFRF